MHHWLSKRSLWNRKYYINVRKIKTGNTGQMYTVTEAVNLLNTFLQTGQITAEQFTELFESAKDLPVNGEKEETEIAEDSKEKEWQEYKEKVDKMWEKFTESGEVTPDPKPEEPDGSKDKPFPATNNMQYYNGKYYTYNDVLYLCNRDTGVPVWHTPDQLVGIYFQVVPTEEG